MTVVNPKSISGINSITMASGSDNLLTIHTTNTTERIRVNSDGDVIVGSGITVSPDGDIFATGVTTSTTFVGNLTGNVTGTASANAVLTGSTNNTVCTVTGANAIQGESNLTFDGNLLKLQCDSGEFRVEAANGVDAFSVDSDNGNTIIGSIGTLTIPDTIVHAGDTDTKIRFPSADTFTVETGGSERIRVDSSGNMGVGGNTSPTSSFSSARDLVIGTASGSNGMTIMSGTSDSGHIEFSDGTGSDATKTAGGIRYYHDADYMRFNTGGGTERLRIDTSGRLIQRYSAAPYDNRAATFQSPAGQTSTYIAVINTETNGASGILFGDHAGQDAGNFDAYINYSHQYQHMQFLVGSGTERLRIKSDGDVSINDGNLVIATSGHGIDFSATGDGPSSSSELLDDYEEGTFTPTYDGTWTNISNSNLRQARYTRIGNTVHVWMEYYMSSNNGAIANNSNIRGFPFTGTSNPADLYPPANVALMYGPSTYLMDETAAGRAYITTYDDRLYFSMGSKSGIRHIWVQLTYPTSY